tara:strand:- start:293 stop:703 length:411 start_codon:yes stop_codon:yes gene_type:complete
LDLIDEEIIKLLKENSRTSFGKIGNTVNLSEAAIRRRINKLLDAGKIKKFTIEIEEGGASAIILISILSSLPTSKISDDLKKVKGVKSIYEITGQYDIVTILQAPNIADINKYIDDIRSVKGVTNTNTVIVLNKVV